MLDSLGGKLHIMRYNVSSHVDREVKGQVQVGRLQACRTGQVNEK